MTVNNAKRLISFGIRAMRLNNSQTRAEVKKLVRAGFVEVKYAGQLAKAVLSESDKERKIITAFLVKEAHRELQKAAPHAKNVVYRATVHGRRLAGKVVSTARRVSGNKLTQFNIKRKKAAPKRRKGTLLRRR